MINTQNYKIEVIKLWEEYKDYTLKIKKDMKNIRDSLDYTQAAKDKKIEELRAQINMFNGVQGKEVLNYLQAGIDHLNMKPLDPIDMKKLLDITNLLKDVREVLNDDEILSLTKEFHDNTIAVKTINAVLGKNLLQQSSTAIVIKNINMVKTHIQQCIESAKDDEEGIMVPFQGWRFSCQVVDISINNIPDKL
ncbi:hypothetical protein [Clostridium algidicarnis]|uniref:hypothetical protein n=1 Tax=Clostridium algidicarnis TaxID=37659 RepID=UPI001C0E37DD|nr:hypothetical protein [Clostridium algidicarnis]MBU3203729.1 hypothetical protein [Clostridium algidicarnis]MBU3211883.1 hypothetical protein [Clostridium algidicarnis]MBU3221611.1 hypothetical protein [Clostridium algidicarnis]